MGLVVYNTLTRTKEPFEPLEPGHVRMYVCGPTVYDHPHLGHARSAIAFDVIRRTLELAGHRVTYVQNITDVDDKIINRANEEGRTPWEVSEEYTRSYDDAMRLLGVRPPTIAPRATGHIAEMVELIERLVVTDHAYAVDGDVFFAVDSDDDYGKLSNRSLDDMRAGERVDVDPRKRHPMDFALWKSVKPGEPSWPSPWGPGRPGWHIECSAMSQKYLGDTFDIHGGGADLIFPHHENEVAQSESGNRAPFAKVWLHNGFVTVDKEKMSKSLKNYMLISDVLTEFAPPVLRYLLVSGQYRTPIDYSRDLLSDAAASWSRFTSFVRNAEEAVASAPPDDAAGEPWRERFAAAMFDDFNTPQALAVLHEIINQGNAVLTEFGKPGDAVRLAGLLTAFRESAAVLGLDPGAWETAKASGPDVGPIVELLLRIRDQARTAKDYARADEVRDALKASGIVVEDRPGGARWYLA